MNSIVVPKRNVFDCILVDFLSAGTNKNHDVQNFSYQKAQQLAFDWYCCMNISTGYQKTHPYLVGGWAHPFKKVCSLNWINSVWIGVRKKNTPKAPSSFLFVESSQLDHWPGFHITSQKSCCAFTSISPEKTQDSNSYHLDRFFKQWMQLYPKYQQHHDANTPNNKKKN